MPKFELVSDFKPTGDQPKAIEELVDGIESGLKHQVLLGATGTGKSLGHADPVYVVKHNAQGHRHLLTPIGELIDSAFADNTQRVRFEGDVEILDLQNGQDQYLAQSFDPQTGEVSLRPVQSFVRHQAPDEMYFLQTRCGRSVTLTGDHNLWVLRDGELCLIRTTDALPTDYLPLPQYLMSSEDLRHLNVLEELPPSNLSVLASKAVTDYEQIYGTAALKASLMKSGVTGAYSKMSAIRRDIRGRGIKIESFKRLIEETDNLGGCWAGETGRIWGNKLENVLPASLELTPEVLKLIGCYIAEGNGQRGYVILANRHPHIRSELEATLRKLGVNFSVRPSSDYQVSSTALTMLLGSMCGKKAREKRLPPFWTQLSNESLAILLQAYFDGDGTVGRASDVIATTASKQLANDLTYALLRFGIWARLSRRRKRATNTGHTGDLYYYITISGSSNLKKFQDAIGFSLDYKASALAVQRSKTKNSNTDVVPIDGAQLRQLRLALGCTANQIGISSGLSRAAIQLIETNQRRPQRSSLSSILNALQTIARECAVEAPEWHDTWHRLYRLCTLRWTPIAHIKQIAYTQPYVYDFCVPGSETFLAGNGGLFVHNTFSAAHVVERTQKPTLVLAHNKTLAAQLYAEFKEFFPRNAVEYYVSYYDYYQPESYVPRFDLYIEKQTDINEQIERLRIAAKAALLSRRDVLIVASVSSIYGTGDPATWGSSIIEFRVGSTMRRESILRELVRLQYTRGEMDLHRGTFRARGDVLEVYPPYEEVAYRIALFGDEIEKITEFDPITGELLARREVVVVFPAAQFMADQDKMYKALNDIEKELEEQIAYFKREGKLLEAQRIEQRTRYDLEMLRETGFTGGIENYSRHLEQRPPGSPPWTLVDYFPKDFLLIIDESHMTIPQVRGMYNGDRSRKEVLVEYGFRLPSAMDNRPLQFAEFQDRINQVIYTSATPGPFEREKAERIVQQIIRPTGVLDPQVVVRPTAGQIDDVLQEIAARVKKGQRALVTTLTQRMAEELAGYINESGIKAHYLHAEIETLERVEILRDLRLGVYDVVVGINLLREGIDLPEVSLVVILDADKEGFLRSESALIQNIGRAARHVEGQVILYADHMTDSMKRAIDETERRRAVQHSYNLEHGITPTTIVKQVRDLTDRVRGMVAEELRAPTGEVDLATLPKDELHRMIKELEAEMKRAAKALEFEKAAMLRDQMVELKGILAERGIEPEPSTM